MARDVAAVVGLVTRQSSPEVEEAMEEEKVADNAEEKDWSLSFLDTLVLDSLAGGQMPYKPRNTRVASMECSSISLLPANQMIGRISAGISESNSNDQSSLISSAIFSSKGEPATLWTLEGRLEVSSPTLEMSPLTPPPSAPQQVSGGLDGLLEEGWS